MHKSEIDSTIEPFSKELTKCGPVSQILVSTISRDWINVETIPLICHLLSKNQEFIKKEFINYPCLRVKLAGG